ncbi:MAG: DUF11 domain-containing protein [bacterium]|nr:DUF11 domain-containing protein [bacterium]
MCRPQRCLAFTIILCLLPLVAMASGTAAGTFIDCQAMVTYSQAGEDLAVVSNLVSFSVNEVLDFTLVWQDASEVPVYAGETGAVLTFQLQNTGNGWETFQLSIINALSGDDFDPLSPSIYFDSNGNGIFDPLLDEIYLETGNTPELAADEPLTIFLISNVPTDLASGDRGHLKIAAGSEEGYGAPGTIVHGQGDGGTDAIIGLGGGFAEATGTLILASVQINLAKSALVTNHDGQSLAPGFVDTTSTITYTIEVTATGFGTAHEVTVTDPIPPGTVYLPGTLFLNEIPLTDAHDSDMGDAAGQMEGTITIALGDMTADTPIQQISFQVTLE